MVEGNRGHHLNVMPYLRKILIRGLSAKNLGFFLIFSESGHSKFLTFCKMVEGNRGHHFSAVPYFGKILIWGLRGIKCQKLGILDIFSETGH